MKPDEFVLKVVENYNKSKGIFQNKINAEELIPQDLDDLHKALYIFYVLQLDYAMKSQILYKGAKQLVTEIKNFFTTQNIIQLTDAELLTNLRKYLHPRYINEAVKRYRVNTEILVELYKSDPRNIFLNTKSGMEILQRLKQFRGFGPKIGNFFVRTMINTFEYSYSDLEKIMPPVDIHDVKISYLLGFTNTPSMTLSNITHVKTLWSKACIDAKQSWLIFDKALWLIGSEGKPKTKEDILRLLE